MRKILSVLIVFTALVLGACAVPQPGAETDSKVTQPAVPPEEDKTESSPTLPVDIAAPARQDLAQKLGIPPEQVTLQNMEAVEWSDSCLGVSRPEESCLAVITPGYIVTFTASSEEYIYHTDASGEIFRQAPAASQEKLLTWERTGGIAGICQRLSVSTDGHYLIEDCKAAQSSQGILSEGHLTYLTGLWGRYASFQWQFEPPAGSADMFIDRYDFYGVGTQQPSEQDRRSLNEYLGNLVSELGTQPAFTPPPGSGIWGQVLSGPTCPGPQPVNDPKCDDQPYQATITILDEKGGKVTQFTTDPDGRFQLPLAPGTYVVHPESSGVYPSTGEQTITVPADQYLEVQIVYDTGIR